MFLPQATETFAYDDDGNLNSDGRWNYTWDGENRLVRMEAKSSVPDEAKRKLDFSYDYMGRRIIKTTYVWNAANSIYQLDSILKFVYDGWNLIAELDGSNAPVRSYSLGQDLSGTLHGASGSGGLLHVNEGGAVHFVGYDGSENVTLLVNSTNGKISGEYEFDPFGVTLKSVGIVSRIGFSSKYTDPESDLVYFGYRFYQTQTGRWISRDPLAPENGINLYSYVVNAPTNFTDFDGLQGRERGFRRVRENRYVESSPNWDGASGGMDRTYHAMYLCVPKLSMEEALSKMFEDLQRFTYFEPNIAKLSFIGANRGHFQITDPNMRGTVDLAGLSIDVIFYSRTAHKQLLAVTTGRHPLVGVRMWRVEKVGWQADRSAVIKVITEAYDQANGWLNDWGRYQMGRDQQRIMWNRYLNNIEGGWYKRYKAIRTAKNEDILQGDQKLPNPFRSLLPPELQKSEYKWYDYVVP